MTQSTDDGTPPTGGYIRGGAGLPTSSRRVIGLALTACLIAIAILSIGLGVDAARQVSRNHRLDRHGVTVQVTVTGCVGMATGTGITEDDFTCRGSFELGGRRYTDVIGGSTELRLAGQRLQAVTDPRSPKTLSLATAIDTRSAWHTYIPTAISVAALLLLAALTGWWAGAHRRRSSDLSEPAPAIGC